MDPYKSPESNVSVNAESDVGNSKIGWKIFFWLFLVLEFTAIVFMIFDPETSGFELFSDFVINAAILMGLFGYSYNRKILIRKLWGYVIPVGIVYDSHSIVTLGWLDISTKLELYILVGLLLLVMFPLMILQYYGLFKYRYRSDEIWSN